MQASNQEESQKPINLPALIIALKNGTYTSDTVTLIDCGITNSAFRKILAAIHGSAHPIRKLDISNNKKLTLVALKDLKDLETFMADYCNIRTLILENCPKLCTLLAQNNGMSKLHINNIATLREVHLGSNLLENVNLDEQQNLGFLDLRNNALKNLDVSAFMKLHTLAIDANPLKWLFLGNCPLNKHFSFSTATNMTITTKSQLQARLANATTVVQHNDPKTFQAVPFVPPSVSLTPQDLHTSLQAYIQQLQYFRLNSWLNLSSQVMQYFKLLPADLCVEIAIDAFRELLAEDLRGILKAASVTDNDAQNIAIKSTIEKSKFCETARKNLLFSPVYKKRLELPLQQPKSTESYALTHLDLHQGNQGTATKLTM